MYILAILYFLLFLVWVVLTLITVYHVLRFAYWTKVPTVITGVYLLFAVGIIMGTGLLLRNVDWQASIDFNIATPELNVPNPFNQKNGNFDVLK